MKPDRRADLKNLLRQCVECGLCVPHCATWAVTGNEVQSPRGRLLLLADVLDQGDEAIPAAYLAAFDLCIGCRACEAVCPSGVPFSLLAWGQQRVVAAGQLADGPSGLGWLLPRLDQVPLLRGLAVLTRWFRRVLIWAVGRHWRRRLDQAPLGGGTLVRLLGSLPTGPATDGQLLRRMNALTGLAVKSPPPPPPPSGPRVVFFHGCANEGLLPHSSRRVLTLLAWAGCRVDRPVGQECCGALATHSGRPGRAARLRRRNLRAVQDLGPDPTPILTEAAGCSLELKGYGADWEDRVQDVTAFLSRRDLPDLGTVPLRVVLHDPCHARHGQGLIHEPRDLLRRIPGLELLEPLEPEVCCGAGGAWGLRHPDLSADLGRRKAAYLAATGAQLAVTTNPGCLGQIQDGLALTADALPLIPLTDLLWYAQAAAQT